MSVSRAKNELRRIEKLYAECLAVLDRPEVELCTAVPTVSAWSPVQHIRHILLVNEAALGHVRRLSSAGSPDGSTSSGSTRGGLSFVGRCVLCLGYIPRGKGRAPESVHPPAEIDHQELQNAVREAREVVEEFRRRTEEIAKAEGRARHFAFGELTALEWLCFARIHMRHHLKIIADMSR